MGKSKKRKGAGVPSFLQPAKKKLIKESAIRQKFNYKIGDIALDFTLRIDINEEMEAFVEIMEEATVDLKKIIDDKQNEENETE